VEGAASAAEPLDSLPDAIPDGWPPDGVFAGEGLVVPMFPLPGVFLYPHQIMPLYVFEPRYRALIEDMLDVTGRFVMGTIREGEDDAAHPSVLPTAGLGEIAYHDRLPDGCFNVRLIGLTRVRLLEVDSDKLYRRVRIDRLHEVDASPEASARLDSLLRSAVMERVNGRKKLPDSWPTSILVDLLSQRLSIPQLMSERIYGELRVEQRAELALDAHARFPPEG